MLFPAKITLHNLLSVKVTY